MLWSAVVADGGNAANNSAKFRAEAVKLSVGDPDALGESRNCCSRQRLECQRHATHLREDPDKMDDVS